MSYKMEQKDFNSLDVPACLNEKQKERYKSVGVLRHPLLTIDGTRFAVVVVCLPLLSFLSCVVLSLLLNFNEVTRTHCNVSKLLLILLCIRIPFLCF